MAVLKKILLPGLAMAVLLSLILIGAGPEKELPPADAFCYTQDQNGHYLESWRSESDGVWYLFLPGAVEPEKLVVFFPGGLRFASAGHLEEDGRTLSGAFRQSGDRLKLRCADGSLQWLEIRQSDLPSVQVYLQGTDLEEIHAEKMAIHPGNTVIITDPESGETLEVSRAAEFRGRGNTTWTLFDKKGYQIKFPSVRSVLGMKEAKRWILLANACDDSMMRSKLVYDMARDLDMAFVPQFRYVDLWVDGQYLGTYLLGEKVEVDPNRLNLTQRNGVLYEHDEAYYMEEEYWLHNEYLQRHFTVKEMPEEHTILKQQALTDLDESLTELAKYLYNTPSRDATLEDLERMVDVHSFAMYYLVNEYVQNRESFATSFFWYKDGPQDVLHMGPVWDFDTCMGNDSVPPDATYGDQHVIFDYMLAIPEFYEYTCTLFEEYRWAFESLEARAEALEEELRQSAEMNYLRWDILGTANPKPHATVFAPGFPEAVDAVQSWLAARREQFRIPRTTVVNSTLSQDCQVMDIVYEPEEACSLVRFAVWSQTQGKEFAHWVDARLVDGRWTAQIDMTYFGAADFYRISAYADGDDSHPVASGKNYAPIAAVSIHPVTISPLNGGAELELVVGDTQQKCLAVAFAIWSEEGGQDDLTWVHAKWRNDGAWVGTISREKLGEMGIYYVHAYGNKNAHDYVFLNSTMMAWTSLLEAEAVGSTLEARLTTVEAYSEVHVAVWSEAGNQADMRWFDARPKGDGTWTCTADLSEFLESSRYYIHAYGIRSEQTDQFLGGITVDLP